jgi:AcrR family transcriptional regulator
MAVDGRRERKKRETTERIALAAETLFGERGYEAVSVVDIADAADVSEQTVYNHFPTKEDLVFDRAEELDAALDRAIRERPEGTPAALAVAPILHGILDRIAGLTFGQQRGGMPTLAAASPALQRAALERTRGHATTIARALADGEAPSPQLRAVGWSLAGLLQLLIEELGSAHRRGQDPADAARRLRGEVDDQVTALSALG